MGNAGATVGDIDNDGLNEVVVGGYMVNKDDQEATYTFTKEDGTRIEFEYYHELAMSYMKYDKDSNTYGNFQGFTVFRNEEEMAWTPAANNETRYNENPSPRLSSSARYWNGQNWTIPIQSVSLTGYVNGRTNHQIFFGNCMYYYDTGSGKFKVYDDGGKVDSSMVAYDDFDAPVSSINTLVPGNFMTGSGGYVPTEGREQLLIVYARQNSAKNHFMLTLMYENSAGIAMDVKKMPYYLGTSPSSNFDQRDYYPTVCAPNMDNDAVFVQYIDYEFTYSKPEILAVLASLPYYEDIYNAYPMWEPGSTYLSKSSGSSQTDTGFAEFSLGWYLSFEQDIGIFGLKLASFEMETSVAISTSQEFSHTVERESSVTYETSGGQDSVVMVSSPLDMYYYRYYEESDAYAAAYPTAVRRDPSTWGIMAVSLPSAPQTLVFPVEKYNQLAARYDMGGIDSDFWMHTSGDPGTYPQNVGQFKNAGNVLSSDSSISATSGSGSVTTELTITESMEYAYTVSLTSEARVGAGVAGAVMGVSFENTLGFGGATVNFRGTTIGASLYNFPNDEYDTSGFSLTTRLHSYTTEFNRKDIMVLYYTVSRVMGLPKLPSSFYLAGRTTDSITLAWEVPEIISDALRPDRYELYRYDSYYNKWYVLDADIEVVPGSKNYYLDTDIYPSETYKYRLVAKDNTGAKTNSLTLEASTLLTGEPPVILLQPRDFTAGAGHGATFSVDARLPENVAPTRLYYQWYQQENESDIWTAIPGANEKNLTLEVITLDMDGYQYCCQVSRLVNNTFPLSADSNTAKLTVTEQPPEKYGVNYAAGINGSVTALEAGAGGHYEISYSLKIAYVIISTKTVIFGSERGKGTVTAVAGVGNTEVSGVLTSGGKVQMYADLVFTAHPEDDFLGVKGWTVNGIYQTNTATDYILKNINKNTTVKTLFETSPEERAQISPIEIKASETVTIEADTIALDDDGDSLTVSGISTHPAGETVTGGVADGKAVITGVNEGTTSAVITVSDGKGHTCDVTVPIKVNNNLQDQPVGLAGIAPTSKDGSDGKITGLIAGKTYQYKGAASMEDYTTLAAIDGSREITGLSAGTYLVRFASIAGYYASKAIEVEVPQYVPKSVAYLDSLSYKVGRVEEKAIPHFNSNTVTYFVVLDDDVENGTEIHLSGVLADSRATVTQGVYGTVEDGFATALIQVTAEDEVTSKTYTANFATEETAGSEISAVTPARACFDKYDSNADDKLKDGTVSFAVYGGDYEFIGITGMTPNTDYIMEDSGNTVTITNSTLHRLENGLHHLAFIFTGGKRCTVVLEIQNSMPIVTGVLVNPATAIVTQGGTKIFTAVVRGVNHGDSVEWSVTGNARENTSVSAEGVLAVDVEEKAGTELTVKAISTVDPDKSGTARVMVVGKLDAAIPVFAVDLTTDTVVYNVGERAAALSVRAVVTDGGTVSYQWYKNTESSTVGGTAIDGENTISYTPSTETAGTKYYYVVATNENPDATGSITATSTSTVKPVQVNSPVHAAAPVITGLTGKTDYLQGDAISEDDLLKVSAVSTDGGELSFQWYLKDPEGGGQGILVSGDNCCIPRTSVAGTFAYYVVVTNTNNNVTGNTTATVTSGHIVVTVEAVVNAAQPAFTEGGNLSGAINYPVGGQASPLTVTATAADLGKGGVLSYQWYMNTLENTEPVQPPKVIKLTIGSTEAIIDGEPYTLDAVPFIKPEASRTLVPLRFVIEALEARVDWQADTRQVVIQDGTTEIILTIDSPEALVNSTPVVLDCPAELQPPGRTFVPLRFVSQTLGARVDWDGVTKTITITR